MTLIDTLSRVVGDKPVHLTPVGRNPVDNTEKPRCDDRIRPVQPASTTTPEETFEGPQWQTPAMRQFVRFKTEHPDCLLLFRMGDFYELFGPDAVIAHQALGITLTERTKGMPMAGVPHHSIESYVRRLVDQGHRVAMCDQIQDPKDAKGVVDRAVTRVLTPGTLVDEALLEDGHENVIAAIVPMMHGKTRVFGIASAELSTGSFTVQVCDPLELGDALARIAPAELLLPDELSSEEHPEASPDALAQFDTALTPRQGWTFRREDADELLREHYGVASLESYGIPADDPALPAAGALLRYLLETQSPQEDAGPGQLGHLRPPVHVRNDTFMALDVATLRSLEIERTSHRGEIAGSLRSVFGHCRTSMGRRLIRHWLCRPLLDRATIDTRQRAVRSFVEDRQLADDLRDAAGKVQDVARIGGRVAVGRCTPRDVVALGLSVDAAVELRDLLADRPALSDAHHALSASLDELTPLSALINDQCVDAPPAHLRDGGVIRDGVDPALDEARGLQRDANTWLTEYQATIIEETGIGALKVGYNKVFGYYIEVSKANDARVPDNFTRKQTLKNAERYITSELKIFEDKVLNAESAAIERERILFTQLCEKIAGALGPLSRFAETVGQIDCLACLAETAHRLGWKAPTLEDSNVLSIIEGRHPVLDASMRDGFVANDCRLAEDGGATLALITGPNMAGKSTYIRQVALIVMLAQAGSYVPAKEARIGITDRIFTRIGASDELHAGRSTFMVEMTETANILHHATDRSLVILDEIGRGTSTLDGLSLAWAIAETLLERKARTLFATHYHELTTIADRAEGVCNLHVAVREWQGKIVFLHRIKPGRTDRSYGIHVAEIAGVPPTTIARAQQLLETLEVREGESVPPADVPAPTPAQMSLFTEYLPHPVVEALRNIELDSLAPLEAFDRLRALVEEARGKE